MWCKRLNNLTWTPRVRIPKGIREMMASRSSGVAARASRPASVAPAARQCFSWTFRNARASPESGSPTVKWRSRGGRVSRRSKTRGSRAIATIGGAAYESDPWRRSSVGRAWTRASTGHEAQVAPRGGTYGRTATHPIDRGTRVAFGSSATRRVPRSQRTTRPRRINANAPHCGRCHNIRRGMS